jgi:hypothetical protein
MVFAVLFAQRLVSPTVDNPFIRLAIQIPIGFFTYASCLILFFKTDVYYVLGKLKPT